MSLYDELENASATHSRRVRPTHPDGWTPGLSLTADGGELVSPPSLTVPDWDALFAQYLPAGWDSSLYEIDEDSVRFTAWDGWMRDGDGAAQSAVQYSFRAQVRHKRTRREYDPDLAAWVLQYKPKQPPKVDEDRTLVVAVADTQMGKADGDGVRGTVDRLLSAFDQLSDVHRQAGKPHHIVIASLGDLIEGCSGHYAQQAFRTELDFRSQLRYMRKLLTRLVKQAADMASRVTVQVVGGNHGEIRQNGKSFTTFADNMDVAVWEPIAEILAENPDRFGHVGFMLPNDDLTSTIDLHGQILGLAHGHQARRGGTVEQKIMNWWTGQMKGRLPIGDADILLTAHYHHLMLSQQSERTWIQAPAMDGGSDWFINQTGLNGPPGLLTFTVDRSGWDHLRVLRGV